MAQLAMFEMDLGLLLLLLLGWTEYGLVNPREEVALEFQDADDFEGKDLSVLILQVQIGEDEHSD